MGIKGRQFTGKRSGRRPELSNASSEKKNEQEANGSTEVSRSRISFSGRGKKSPEGKEK